MVNRTAAAALVGFGVAGALVALTSAQRRAHRRWGGTEDPCGALRDLPLGQPFKVETDDGAVLSGIDLPGTDPGAPTVVLAHCWTGNRFVWAPVARRLVDAGCRVVLYDHRGHGESVMGVDPVTIERLAADLATVLDHLDAQDVVLAGHSMGGMTVQALAIHHPDVVDHRVQRLVLVATAARPPSAGPFPALMRTMVGHPRTDQLLRSAAGVTFMRSVFGLEPRLAHIVETRDDFVDTDAHVRVACADAMAEMDLRPHLPGVTVPTTVVVGGRDTLLPPELGREIAELVAEARVVEVRDAGHMLPFEAHALVADLIAAEAGRTGASIGVTTA